ncbi:hypothetical protein COLO4_09760 [Corchorus olitorius]|uniref:Uncharacterized protein n=1 Tax=Corchorus olitorius TaxID=93759 RepID=A0A1R3KB63_9ROSI|nr:hypothetical protein COLO4_09760 [Corchorus olitorius]
MALKPPYEAEICCFSSVLIYVYVAKTDIDFRSWTQWIYTTVSGGYLRVRNSDADGLTILGFTYHSPILDTHVIKGGEKLWELVKKIAMENPGLTSSSSLISVFEDTVIDESNDQQKQVGLGDYMACASTHGIAPSIAIFDSTRHATAGWIAFAFISGSMDQNYQLGPTLGPT